MSRPIALAICMLLASLLAVRPAAGQGLDLTVFVGRAYPTFEDRLTLRPTAPSLPGVEVTVAGTPEIRAAGGQVFGAALAFELGVLGIEGRFDATDVGFDLTGARYDLRATGPPFEGFSAGITLADGRFDADRLEVLSLNVRLRTPGPVGLVASAGVSYLPGITITGSVPVAVQVAGLPSFPALAPRLTLEGTPGQAEHRYGANGGAGLRVGGRRVALMAEVRAFYFREFELRFGARDGPDLIGDLLGSITPVRFEPVLVNAQAGLVLRF
jgi:hypothetical protein